MGWTVMSDGKLDGSHLADPKKMKHSWRSVAWLTGNPPASSPPSITTLGPIHRALPTW